MNGQMKDENGKTLGVIGGLGPMATAYFLRLLVQMTLAQSDQEHLDAIVFNRPGVPDRTAYILDREKPSPLPSICDSAKKLEALGACCIAIPCITSHYFFKEFSSSVSIPFLNILEECAALLKQSGVRRAGILATTGTVQSGLFQNALQRAGIEAVIPDGDGQALVMELIYGEIKAGRPVKMELFQKASRGLRDMGSECCILGCTELSLLKRDYTLGSGYLDALEALARAAVLRCGKPLRAEYRTLITEQGE